MIKVKKYEVVGGIDGTLILAETNWLWWAKLVKWFYGADRIDEVKWE